MTTLSINGVRKTGQEVRDDNMTAALSLANIVKNSFGPAGLDKMIIDGVGDLKVTNDGATILKLIEVHHPAAKILASLAELQDKEVGDNTTSVVILAAELVRKGNELVKSSIHPTTVISGFQQAKKAACKFIAENLSYKLESLGGDCLLSVAKTAMSSKSIGQAENHFAKLAVDAMKKIGRLEKAPKASKKASTLKYNVNQVGVLLLRGDRLEDSELLEGIAFIRNRSLSSFGMPQKLESPKIAFIDFDLRREKLPFNVKVICEDPAQLEAIRKEEISSIERRIKLVLDAGATAIFSSRSIDEFALKEIARRGCVALKNVPKADLKRAASATGGRVLTSLATLDSKDCAERVPLDALGSAESLAERRFGDAALLVQILAKKTKSAPGGATLLLRGPSKAALEESARAVHDVLCALKRVMESSRVTVGGGAVEAALSVYLENYAETIGSREQSAIAEYASALLSIPKTLATNAGLDSILLTASLRAAHEEVIAKGKIEFKNIGLDLKNNRLRDSLNFGVLEPAMSKIKCLKFATEAATAILRIDDSIQEAQTAEEVQGNPMQ